MDSPLGKRKVRLRGLGGPAVCDIPRTCASAAKGMRGSDERVNPLLGKR
jgi:hypothetical protein